MTKSLALAVVAATLVLPALAGADTVWRWQDSTGRLHYSNVASHVPAHAVQVEAPLGIIQGGVAAPDMRKVESDLAAARKAPSTQAAYPSWAAPAYSPWPICTRLAVPLFLALNGHDLADQVEEASILDMLHVPWRSGGLCM